MIGSLMYVTSSRPDIMFATSESEYVAVSSCCAQVLWTRTQLMDYGFFYDKVLIYCDSKSAIAISCNPIQHTRTKHIDVRIRIDLPRSLPSLLGKLGLGEAVFGPAEGKPLILAVLDAFSIMLANLVKVLATLFRRLGSVSKVWSFALTDEIWLGEARNSAGSSHLRFFSSATWDIRLETLEVKVSSFVDNVVIFERSSLISLGMELAKSCEAKTLEILVTMMGSSFRESGVKKADLVSFIRSDRSSSFIFFEISSNLGSLFIPKTRLFKIAIALMLSQNIGPEYPEYLPPADDMLLAKEQPLPVAVSPTAKSPGYITDEGDNDANDDGDDLSEDDANDEDEEESSDSEEEEEEHQALTVPALAQYSSVFESDETEPFEEGKIAATPPPFGYRIAARISIQPHILMPFRMESEAFPLPGESSHWQYKFPLPVNVVPTARRLKMPLLGVCTAIEEIMKKLPVKDRWQLH
nr:Gag-Pol polyprotein [Tanacetum cinerariifolium]